MSTRIISPTAELERLQRVLNDLVRSLPLVQKRVGATLVSLVKQGFAAGRSPDGGAWKPVKRGGRPLRKTGKLANSTHAVITGGAVAVHVDAPYAMVHQRGAVIQAKAGKSLAFKVGNRLVFAKKVVIPARPFLPVGGLPAAWEAEVAKAVQRSISAFAKKATP